MIKLIASSSSKAGLERLINKYYASDNYIITGDNIIINNKLNKAMDGCRVVNVGGRWRFELMEVIK